jgi:hypothetical protein
MQASNIYRVWLPQVNRIILSRDVLIDEKLKYDKNHIPPLTEPPERTIITATQEGLDEDTIDTILGTQEQTQTQVIEDEREPSPDADETQPGSSIQKVSQNQSLPTPPAGSRQSSVVLQSQQDTEQENPLPPSPVSEQEQTQTNEMQTTEESQAINEEITGNVAEALNPPPQRTYTRRPTEATALTNLRSRSGRPVKLSNKAQMNQVSAIKRSLKQPDTVKRCRYEQLEQADDDWNMNYAFASSQTRRHRSDLQAPPEHWGDVKCHPDREDYEQAARVEILQLAKKGTFEVVTPPQGKQILPLRWVFTHKLDTAGYLLRFKARICVRGDLQQDLGGDVYAATGAYRTFRILMSLVAAFDLICHSADVTNAFLNAPMKEEVYVKCPPGFDISGEIWTSLCARTQIWELLDALIHIGTSLEA